MVESRETKLVNDVMGGTLSRRDVVRRGVALGLSIPAIGAILAACGDNEDANSDVASDTTTPGETEQETEEETEEETEDETTEATEEETDEGTAEAPADDEIRITGPYEGEAGSLNGAGASFPAVLYSKWFSEYEAVGGVQVNYQSIGSGGGIKSIQDKTVDFGATDGPMDDEQLANASGGHIFHIPAAMGAVVATYNIPELDIDQPLRFTNETLSGIFLGEITTWNDPALVEDNPQLEEIDQNILVIHRSDGSGTTFIFTDYLASVNEAWANDVGFGTSVDWPTGLGANGNEGVAGEVNQNSYSIGYVELIYALQNELGVADIQNSEGEWITPTTESVSQAAAGFADEISDDLRDRIVNAPGAESYPISGFTWLLAYEEQEDEETGIALTRMLWWCMTDAQQYNEDLGYASIPDEITAKAKEMIWDIKYNGEPVFPGE